MTAGAILPGLPGMHSIKRRLGAGFAALVALLVVAGVVGWQSLRELSARSGGALRAVQAEAHLSAQFSAAVAQEMHAAERYRGRGDSVSGRAFHALSAHAHRVQRRISKRDGQTAPELALLAAIDDTLSAIEVRFARAHRLADLGRADAAAREADAAVAGVGPLLADIDQLGQIKTRKGEAAAAALEQETASRSRWLIGIIGLALAVALVIAVRTVGSIYRPLRVLVEHARELSAGNLAVRTTDALPSEFETLATAMNQTSDSLSRVASVAATTADDVSGSARELSSVAEQISSASNQAAAAMGDITAGAESQVQQLRAVDQSLQVINRGAVTVLDGANEVGQLAGTIENAAQAKRAEVERTLGILLDVRGTVQRASVEVAELDRAAESINRFVGTVSRIAEQTNLLALNAAIEAARAGAAGRGFTVVAEEVRALANQAQAAADDVIAMTSVVTRRVASTSAAMQAGVTHVAEIEHLSRDLDAALSEISGAAERTRAAAGGVTAAAYENRVAVADAAASLSAIARTAEGYAATAQQVSASTQEQSAACEQMSSASAQLLLGSTQLREIVGGFKSGKTAVPIPA